MPRLMLAALSGATLGVSLKLKTRLSGSTTKGTTFSADPTALAKSLSRAASGGSRRKGISWLVASLPGSGYDAVSAGGVLLQIGVSGPIELHTGSDQGRQE